MTTLDPTTIDIATLAWLSGSAANEFVLAQLRSRGHAGVRISHGYVMQHLVDRQPTVSELAAALAVTQQAASKQVVDLERLGYVARSIDPADSRARRIALTPRGERLLADSRALRGDLEARLAAAAGTELGAARAVLLALADLTDATHRITTRSVVPPTD